MRPLTIGVFDSGIGGLTVLKKLIMAYPDHEYIYYGDTLNLPYGTKSKETLAVLAEQIINFLLAKGAQILVIACGTISSNLYEQLKNKYKIPIIDVLNPVVNYIKAQGLKNIGIFATPMTISSHTFTKKIGFPVKEIACPLFVPLIESGKINTLACERAIKKYLKELGPVDNIILGCTHYPLLKNALAKYTSANLIDMADGVVKSISLDKKTK